MEIFHILDEIEFTLKESKRVPLSGGKVMVEADRLLDQIDRIRAILPEELDTARLLLMEKERIVKEAEAEAEQYVEDSRSHVARLVDENEITQHAMKMADDIMTKAEGAATDIRREANEYSADLLTHVELVLKKSLEAVTTGKDEINFALKNNDY